MKFAVYIIDRPLRNNDRGVVSAIERLQCQHQVIVLANGLEVDMDNILCYDYTFGVQSNFMQKVFRRIQSSIVFILLVYLFIRYKPQVLYVRELLVLNAVYWATRFYCPEMKIIDVRENPVIRPEKLQRYLCRWGHIFDKTVTISPFMEEELSKKYKMTPVHVEYAFPAKVFLNAIDFQLHTSDPQRLRICFFGDIKPDRKIDLMIQAVNMVQSTSVVFDIYGRMVEKEYGFYLKELDENNVTTFHGLLDYSQSPQKLVTYDCGILINEINENSVLTIPGKFWEYLSCGLCLIANERPTVADFIQQYRLGLIGNSPLGFADILQRLHNDRGQLAKFRTNSRAFFEKMYKTYDI